MDEHRELSVIFHVAIVEEDRDVRLQVRDRLQEHPLFRVVGAVPDLARACALARRANLDLIVVGRVDLERRMPALAVLRGLAPYARVVLYGSNLPDTEGAETVVMRRSLDALVAAVLALVMPNTEIDVREERAEEGSHEPR